MNPKPFLFFMQFLPLSKLYHVNMMMPLLENYIVHPAKNPALLISGSVVTLTSLNQWNIFDIRYISGGSIEYVMIVNALSVLQFLIGWKATTKKVKPELEETRQESDTKIMRLQSEINELRSRLVPH